jgi:hypothetical protein
MNTTEAHAKFRVLEYVGYSLIGMIEFILWTKGGKYKNKKLQGTFMQNIKKDSFLPYNDL